MNKDLAQNGVERLLNLADLRTVYEQNQPITHWQFLRTGEPPAKTWSRFQAVEINRSSSQEIDFTCFGVPSFLGYDISFFS